jgi:hypothetical protein
MTQYARPDNDPTQTTNWVPSTGSSLYAMIDEASTDDGDWVQVTDDMMGQTETFKVDLGTVTDPVSSSDHKVTVRASDSVGFGSVTFTVKLKQGATTISNITSFTLAGSVANYTYTLPTAEADSITSYGSLLLEISAEDTMMGAAVTNVYQAFFECPDALAPAGRALITHSPAVPTAYSAAYSITKTVN